MADVAAAAGVSHQTVSRVLNDHPSVRPATRARVLDAIAALGYRRNSAARALVTARTATVGVVTTGSPLFGPASTLNAVEEAAREAGFFVSVASVRDPGGARTGDVLEHFMSQGVEGIVAIAPHAAAVHAVHDLGAPVPTVLVRSGAGASDGGTGDRPAPQRATGPIVTVGVDQRIGARLATEHLLGLGHTAIAHVPGPLDWFDARERLAGWRQALADAGLAIPEVSAGQWSADHGHAAGRELVAARHAGPAPTAVFAGSDEIALGLLRALWEGGLSVPGDVSVVGFDDIAGSAHFLPPLTTVRQPFGDLGRSAVRLLGEMIAGRVPGDEAISPRVEVRRSTEAVS